jgi:hypothetical protein
MANTLTNLIPSAYRALNVVSRELVGFIPSVQLDPSSATIAQNQSIFIPAAPSNTAGKNITAAMSIPTIADQTIATTTHTLSKARAFPFSWSGEEVLSVNQGPGYLSIQEQQIAQAIRAAVNEIEVDIAVAAKNGASRAFGTTAGTAPVLADWAQTKKILDDNGAPMSDRTSVFNTTAGVALRNTSNLFKVNEAGEAGLLRQGALGNLYGFNLRESAQIQSTTAGAMTGALVNGALSIGATALVFDTGTVNVTGIVAGDILTIAGDTNKYVVATGSVAAAGTITLAAPGLRQAAADNAAITVFATSARNTAFSRNSILLSTRLPASTPEDMATDRQVITDPNSGISFELAMYPGYRMVHYEIGLCWGVTVIKPEHLAVIIG